MRDIVIVGAGGFAREVGWLIEEIGRHSPAWRLLGYLDSRAELAGEPCGNGRVIGDDSFLERYGDDLDVAIAIGNPTIVDRLGQRLRTVPGLCFPNLVHPSVLWDQKRVRLGHGNIICAGNILTTEIRIGSFNILNLASTYGHDVVIGDNCVINPGVNVSGNVAVGNNCLIGTGARVLEQLRIGDGAVVGAGAVVTRDVDPGMTVVGIPAKPIVRKETAQDGRITAHDPRLRT